MDLSVTMNIFIKNFLKKIIINTGDLDFSETSREKLGLLDMEVGETRTVNLFETGINELSLSFGKIEMTYEGNDQFSIRPNDFDFDYKENASFSRNAATFLGGALFGRFFDTPIYLPHLHFLQPNIFIGGTFRIIFTGTTTIR